MILACAPVDLPRVDEIHIDVRVLLFTVVISVLAGLLFGILPAWRLARTDPQDAMRMAARGTRSRCSRALFRRDGLLALIR